MTKRTRALAGLTAGVLAVSAMAFGFSKWSSNVDLNGTVSANGKWEVAVTAADASISNTGAEMKKINTESSYTVVTYPVYVDYRASSGYYSFRIGDDKAAETKISYNDFMTNYEKNTAKWIGVSKFDSGAKSGNYTFMLNVAGEYENIVKNWWNRSSLEAADGGASDGKQIGTAIAWLYDGRSTNTPANDKIKLTWDAANTYFAENRTTTATAQITDNAVTYAPVTFTLPEAWANYKVTVTNNGTVNANLFDYKVETSLGGDAKFADVFQVTAPEFGKDEVLAPGESCTFNVVVKAKNGTDNSIESDTGKFTIPLNYVQDDVEAAPTVGHTHSKA